MMDHYVFWRKNEDIHSALLSDGNSNVESVSGYQGV